jgi:hypothetical protein
MLPTPQASVGSFGLTSKRSHNLLARWRLRTTSCSLPRRIETHPDFQGSHSLRSPQKIASVDVYGTPEARYRTSNRMNNVVAQRFGVANAQCGLDSAAAIGQSPPKHVVLSTAVDADHSLHLMIVRDDLHHGPQTTLRIVRSDP